MTDPSTDERLLDAERDIQARLGDRPIDFESMHAIANIYRAASAVRRHAERDVLARAAALLAAGPEQPGAAPAPAPPPSAAPAAEEPVFMVADTGTGYSAPAGVSTLGLLFQELKVGHTQTITTYHLASPRHTVVYFPTPSCHRIYPSCP